jgi:hypothetical protein
MANNAFQAWMKGFTGAGLFGKSSRPGAPPELAHSRRTEELPEQTEVDKPTRDQPRQTMRVGRETVEIDVEGVKQFIETVRDKSSSNKN